MKIIPWKWVFQMLTSLTEQFTVSHTLKVVNQIILIFVCSCEEEDYLRIPQDEHEGGDDHQQDRHHLQAPAHLQHQPWLQLLSAQLRLRLWWTWLLWTGAWDRSETGVSLVSGAGSVLWWDWQEQAGVAEEQVRHLQCVQCPVLLCQHTRPGETEIVYS